MMIKYNELKHKTRREPSKTCFLHDTFSAYFRISWRPMKKTVFSNMTMIWCWKVCKSSQTKFAGILAAIQCRGGHNMWDTVLYHMIHHIVSLEMSSCLPFMTPKVMCEIMPYKMICQQARLWSCVQNFRTNSIRGSALTFSSFIRRYNGIDAAITKQMLMAKSLQ